MSCRPDSPLRCAGRAAAMQREEFRYVDGWGWVWWRAQNPTRPWTRCPWCDGTLPTMVGRVGGWHRDGWPDADDATGVA